MYEMNKVYCVDDKETLYQRNLQSKDNHELLLKFYKFRVKDSSEKAPITIISSRPAFSYRSEKTPILVKMRSA